MKSRYAVNLCAMLNVSKQPEHAAIHIVLRQIVTEEVVMDPGCLGTEALVVREDLKPGQFLAIARLLQMRFRPEEFPLYENKGKGWRRLKRLPTLEPLFTVNIVGGLG